MSNNGCENSTTLHVNVSISQPIPITTVTTVNEIELPTNETRNETSCSTVTQHAVSSNYESTSCSSTVPSPPNYERVVQSNQPSSNAIVSHAIPNLPPPPYDEVNRLPTYEEVQREKILGGESIELPRHSSDNNNTSFEQRITMLSLGDRDANMALLGTDFTFFTAFLIVFVFNWIGFLILVYFWHTVAARYGAVAGFGLSLVKWMLILKISTQDPNDKNNWFWWFIIAFGLLICIRSFFQYIIIKKSWNALSSRSRQRYFFFY